MVGNEIVCSFAICLYLQGALFISHTGVYVLHSGCHLATVELWEWFVIHTHTHTHTNTGINLCGILQVASDDRNIEPANRSRTVHILSRHIDDALKYQRDYGTRKKVSCFVFMKHLFVCLQTVFLLSFFRVGKIYGAFVCILYCLVKLLYLANVIGQFVLLNRFLETSEYPLFGGHIILDLLQVDNC
jgi:hypothetical protein